MSVERQITLSENGADWVSGTTVVLLALASPAAYVIFSHSIVALWVFSEQTVRDRTARRRSHTAVPATDQTRLLPSADAFNYYPVIREKGKPSRTPNYALIQPGRMVRTMSLHDSISNEYTGFRLRNLKIRKRGGRVMGLSLASLSRHLWAISMRRYCCNSNAH